MERPGLRPGAGNPRPRDRQKGCDEGVEGLRRHTIRKSHRHCHRHRGAAGAGEAVRAAAVVSDAAPDSALDSALADGREEGKRLLSDSRASGGSGASGAMRVRPVGNWRSLWPAAGRPLGARLCSSHNASAAAMASCSEVGSAISRASTTARAAAIDLA